MGCLIVCLLLNFFEIPTVHTEPDSPKQSSQPSSKECDNHPQKKSLFARWFKKFDRVFLRPLLTHHTPSLAKTCEDANCCLKPLGKLFTSDSQIYSETITEEFPLLVSCDIMPAPSQDGSVKPTPKNGPLQTNSKVPQQSK